MKMLMLITIAILLVFGYPIAYYFSTKQVEFTITKMDRITTSTGSGKMEGTSSKYLIFTNNEVFEDTDSWLFVKFNSSDIYSKLQIGSTYKVKVTGWRVPFLSWYRNIISIKN